MIGVEIPHHHAFCSFSVYDTYVLRRSYLILICISVLQLELGLRKYDGATSKGIPENSVHKRRSRFAPELSLFVWHHLHDGNFPRTLYLVSRERSREQCLL